MLKTIKRYLTRRYNSRSIFNKSLVAIHEIKPVLTLDKPVYIGFSILDLSKFLMYEFHYNTLEENIIKLSCYLQTQTV